MFLEGKAQNNEAVRDDSQAYTASQLEVASYIGDMTSELQAMAHKSGRTVLAYVLSMALMRVRQIESGLPTIVESSEKSCRVG